MISVCMATYNGEKYIEEQLKSILKQIKEEDEIVISDDGSSDNTLEVIKQLSDKRIKIFLNQGEHGYTPNFENALRNASGDYIFLSDQDDIWLDDKVKTIMNEFGKGFNFVYSDCITVNNKMEHLQESRIETYNIKKGGFRTLIKTRYLGCCCAFDKKMLQSILPFPKNYKILEHDTWIASLANFYFKVSIISKPLVLYRRHDSNTSNGGFTSNKNYYLMIKRRIYRFNQILKRRKQSKKSLKGDL